MYEFKIEVKREDRWWMVYIPEIDGLTQARRLSEAETMAREFIALDRGIPFDQVKVETASVRMEEPEFAELLERARSIKARRARAQELEREVSRDAQQFAQWLTTYGVPVRDIADLLGVSPQRVSQLANS
jgi:predicted XRE-type DNA-binding protein